MQSTIRDDLDEAHESRTRLTRGKGDSNEAHNEKSFLSFKSSNWYRLIRYEIS